MPAGAKIAIIVVALLLILIVAGGAALVILRKPNPQPAPTPTPTPTASPAPSQSPAGWVSDRSLLTGTIPARAREGHGCLAKPTTLTNGAGSGVGVVGNGDATPIRVFVAGEPLVGRFAPDGPLLRVYALYCYSTAEPVDVGAMIDIAVTDAAGNAVPITPPDVFNVVANSMNSGQVVFFPVFDPKSLALSTSGDDLVLVGLTADTAYQKDEIFQFSLLMVPQPGAQAVAVSASSKLTRIG